MKMYPPTLSYQRRAVRSLVGPWALCTLIALSGCASYDEPRTYATAVYSSPGVEVRITSEADFYEPLSPYGEWIVIGSYGRCWRPRAVAATWRPYSEGHWEWTDAGWYWVSDEAWGWATCHYGRWDLDDDGRWFWIPQVQWAPAWVEWREGDGYIGWAPAPPAGRASRMRPNAYVFVEERRFSEPIRPTTVIVNNTTIINRTVNITNTRVVNNTVINQGPRPEVIEQRIGRRLTPAPVHQVRTREEAKVERRPRPASTSAQEQNRPYRTPQLSPSERRAAAPRAPASNQAATVPEQRRAEEVNRLPATRVAPNAEADRGVAERAVREQAERNRAAAERVEKERAANERATAERARQVQAERERAAAENAAKVRADRDRELAERAQQERQANERAMAERERNARAEAERSQRERAERERPTPQRVAPAESHAQQQSRPVEHPNPTPPQKKKGKPDKQKDRNDDQKQPEN